MLVTKIIIELLKEGKKFEKKKTKKNYNLIQQIRALEKVLGLTYQKLRFASIHSFAVSYGAYYYVLEGYRMLNKLKEINNNN